ncbi:MAG: TIGR02466 family protein [Alphaproteobacteria bacterium]
MAEGPQAFADARIVTLFPTCIWMHDLKPEDYEPINAAIVPKILELIEPRAETIAGGIWQTHHDLHHLPEFKRLTAFMRKAAGAAIDFLKFEHKEFAITGCWANINPPDTIRTRHMHPNNVLSGVYYAQTPRESDGLVFHDPRPQPYMISPRVTAFTEATGSEIKTDVRPGRMIIFPSWLDHSVLTTGGEGERICVSFNVNLTEFTEKISPPKWDRKPSVGRD